MAAEPPRSSASSADPYIGSLISLTSKSEIRYEGILITINTEESSIALRNVRSFGTEGRKKDGPQVPPSDKIYEYILFRGSDINDLQVKSSPSVQATTPVPNDPAIIQSHYPPASIASTSLPSSATGSIQHPNVQSSQIGIPRPTFQSNPPLYQPSGSIGSWIPLPPPSLANNMSGLPMPMYWQGMYGNLNGFPAQQQLLLRPPPGVSVPPTMQQKMQYPSVNVSYPIVGSNVPTTNLSNSSSPLLPALTPGIQNFLSSAVPAQSLAAVSDSSTGLIPNKLSTQSLPTAALSTGLPLATPLTTILDKAASLTSVSDKSKTIHSPVLPHLSISESVTPFVSTSTYLNEGAMPSLVTPGQLLQSVPITVSISEPSLTAQKDVEVVQISSSELSIPQSPADTEVQEPIAALPSSSDNKVHATTARIQHGNRGGRDRGRGYRFSHPVTRFTEEFDFIAMNEKFNKDEVWGDLGKSKTVQDSGDGLHDEDDYGASKHEIEPVYVKDDFFDSLSCDALDGGSHNGKTKFSEQLRKDTETFGYMPRYRGARGGRGPGHGGRSRGSYYGRGHGYVGRGRGHNYPYRAM